MGFENIQNVQKLCPEGGLGGPNCAIKVGKLAPLRAQGTPPLLATPLPPRPEATGRGPGMEWRNSKSALISSILGIPAGQTYLPKCGARSTPQAGRPPKIDEIKVDSLKSITNQKSEWSAIPLPGLVRWLPVSGEGGKGKGGRRDPPKSTKLRSIL